MMKPRKSKKKRQPSSCKPIRGVACMSMLILALQYLPETRRKYPSQIKAGKKVNRT
mgnify:CR=1 FL=1|jgi:hypothetical protein